MSSVDEQQSLVAWDVPAVAVAEPCHIEAIAGSYTTVVGPNGAGKSALGHWLEVASSGVTAQRLLAHRRLWLEHAGPNITSADRESVSERFRAWRHQPQSRWLDHAQAQRPAVVSFDLLAQVNERNARVADIIDGGGFADDVAAKLEESPIVRLNRILVSAHLGVELVLTSQATFDAVAVGGARYPISQMSNGEKSAVLLAAEVLAAPQASILIIDEPERHLHRSISAGLIEAVVADRSDCHFVILTHGLDLASSLPEAKNDLLVLTGCTWSGETVVAWDLLRVPDAEELPDTVRSAILGGRRRILFLEGDEGSLDAALYRLLVPGWTVQTVGSCELVIRAVTGLRSSATLHWLEPWGIVDGDGRSQDERDALLSRKILALPVSEIENVYYLPTIIDALAEQQAKILEVEAAKMRAAVRISVLAELNMDDVAERLAADVAEKILRRRAIAHLPDAAQLRTCGEQVAVSIPSPYADQLEAFVSLHAEGDLEGIIGNNPIRDTGVRGS